MKNSNQLKPGDEQVYKKTGLKDGGSRQQFGTGALKEDSSNTIGKGAYHLTTPIPMRAVAEIYRNGAIKYTKKELSKEGGDIGTSIKTFCDCGYGYNLDNEVIDNYNAHLPWCDVYNKIIYEHGNLLHYSNGERNWEKGIPLSRLLDSAKRHLDQFHEGWEDEQHLSQCLWNICGIIHTMEMIQRGLLPPSLNDLPSYGINNKPTEVTPGIFIDKWREPGPGLNLPPHRKGLWGVTKGEKNGKNNK